MKDKPNQKEVDRAIGKAFKSLKRLRDLGVSLTMCAIIAITTIFLAPEEDD